jgi:hypothetical protein
MSEVSTPTADPTARADNRLHEHEVLMALEEITRR